MSLSMLDKDTCAFILRRSSPTLLARVQAVPLQQQAASVITLAELLYGVQVSSKTQRRRRGGDEQRQGLRPREGARGRGLDDLI